MFYPSEPAVRRFGALISTRSVSFISTFCNERSCGCGCVSSSTEEILRQSLSQFSSSDQWLCFLPVFLFETKRRPTLLNSLQVYVYAMLKIASLGNVSGLFSSL